MVQYLVGNSGEMGPSRRNPYQIILQISLLKGKYQEIIESGGNRQPDSGRVAKIMFHPSEEISNCPLGKDRDFRVDPIVLLKPY